MRYLLEILSWVFIFLAIRVILRNFISGYRRSHPAPGASSGEQSAAPTGGELKKDPVCGTYVSAATSLSLNSHGQTVYFCSKECRDKYIPS